MWGYLLGEDAATDTLAQKASLAYADLVAAGKDVALWPDHLRQQVYLGDEAFVLRMQALASDRAVIDKEIPKAQRASPKTLHDWMAELPNRDEALLAAHRYSQLSMSQISRELGLSVSRVSRIIARADRAPGDGAVARALDSTRGSE